MESKYIAIIAIVAVIVIGAGLWATGSIGTTDNSLNGQEIHLAAAASLKNAYDNDLIPMFEKKYPGVKVVPTYASSGDLQTQIENGNDVDVFMSAATKQMNALINESLIDNSTNREFLENKVVLIVPKDSKNNISSFDDLKKCKWYYCYW
jgi:molybdate transport system substrate-binding protein